MSIPSSCVRALGRQQRLSGSSNSTRPSTLFIKTRHYHKQASWQQRPICSCTASISSPLLRVTRPSTINAKRALSGTSLRAATEASTPASSTDSPPPVPVTPKIEKIIDQIASLTLLETADLVRELKSRLAIPDMVMAGGMAGGPAGSGAAAPAAAEAEEDADAAGSSAPKEKTLFTLHLKSFEAGSKPKVIKEIKSLLGLSLVESKKFVESAPKLMRENVPKDEGEKIMEALKAVGGVVTLE